MSYRHSVSVNGVVYRDDGSVLVVKRQDTGAWVTPGGVLEQDESIEDGLQREVKEETGLDVEVHDLATVWKNTATGVVSFTFRCRAHRADAHEQTDEASEVRWVTPLEAQELLSPVIATRIRDAERQAPVTIRTIHEPRIMTPR